MSSYSSDRRSVLKIFGAIGATCAYPFSSDELYAQQTPESEHSHPPPKSVSPHFFNDTDFATISRIADLIIPATDTPGAVEAGVPEYIDSVLARNTDQQLVVADGLRWLDAEARRSGPHTFLELNEQQQLAILEPLCEAADQGSKLTQARNVQFFALLKNLTADGYYTSRIGLIEELGYRGNAARATFPTCGEPS
ncbi:MAG TPA: gluconate 2-dehydrogenase subunit 3 family protein [Bryobacteraceae bacterium]|jgi:hypothetical protein|nr:gluconate 2-dehydrogenase subunit 3 family protein [Bryobacteraceae bacterium]